MGEGRSVWLEYTKKKGGWGEVMLEKSRGVRLYGVYRTLRRLDFTLNEEGPLEASE